MLCDHNSFDFAGPEGTALLAETSVVVEPSKQKREGDLAALRGWLGRLLDLTDRVAKGVRCSEEDHLGFMALCFVFKQIDHAKSVLALVL